MMFFKNYYINKFFNLNQIPENQVLGVSTHGSCLDCGKEVNPAEYNHAGDIRYLYDQWYRENELPYVAKVWNPKSEEELVNEFKQNFIDSPKDQLTKIAKKYLTDKQIKWLENQFRKTHSATKPVEGALRRFLSARINQLGVSPKYIFQVRECINCGRHFGERDVWRRAYLGGIFDTCQDCCNMAVLDIVDDRYMKYLVEKGRVKYVKRQSKNETEMLKDVKILVDLLENIPPVSSDYTGILLNPKFSRERRKEIIKHLYFMERPYFYKKVFGTWFHALVEANVLDKNAQRLSRGTRCLAEDGHLCRSLAEKMVDDWMYAHSIPHEVEPLYPAHKTYNPNRGLRGDWLINEVFIEFLGLMEDSKYREKIEKKKMIAKENAIKLILIEPYQLTLLENLLSGFIDKVRVKDKSS